MTTISQLTKTPLSGSDASQSKLPNNKTNQIEQKTQSLQVSKTSDLALLRDDEGQNRLALELYDRFHSMKTYGKEPESLKAIISVFLRDLAQFPADIILKAISTHAQRSDEFPTVADIYGLIKRNGKAPITEAMYVAANRKDGADRTGEDWEIIREFEADRFTGWDDGVPELDRYRELQDEITRLRNENASLWSEKERAWGEVRKYRESMSLKEEIPLSDKVNRTIEAMKAAGAPQADIDEFLDSMSKV